jgi:hypothetical protein
MTHLLDEEVPLLSSSQSDGREYKSRTSHLFYTQNRLFVDRIVDQDYFSFANNIINNKYYYPVGL